MRGPFISLTSYLQRCMSVVFLFLVKPESDWAGHERSTFFAGKHSLGFRSFELGAGLFAIADGVIGAERYLLAAGKQEFFAALHQIFLVEGPGVHEILEHDHEHVLCDVADRKTLRQAAGLARKGKLVEGLL